MSQIVEEQESSAVIAKALYESHEANLSYVNEAKFILDYLKKSGLQIIKKEENILKN